MSAVDEEEAVDMITCCASCGKAEVDDVKLKICTDSTSFDIAASTVRKIIVHSIKRRARRERLNYVMNFY